MLTDVHHTVKNMINTLNMAKGPGHRPTGTWRKTEPKRKTERGRVMLSPLSFSWVLQLTWCENWLPLLVIDRQQHAAWQSQSLNFLVLTAPYWNYFGYITQTLFNNQQIQKYRATKCTFGPPSFFFACCMCCCQEMEFPRCNMLSQVVGVTDIDLVY